MSTPMIGFIIGLCYAIAGFIVGAICVVLGIMFLKKSKEMKEKNDIIAKFNDDFKEKKANSIAALPPGELNAYLAKVYAMIMEVTAIADVSEQDPTRNEQLYARSLVGFVDYLGADTVEAIEYFYGRNYITRWCELNFRILENSGALGKVFSNRMNVKEISDKLDQATQ